MNSPPLAIESDLMLFDKLLAPIEAIVSPFDIDPHTTAASKLGFALFVRVLLFGLFAQIRSLRDLTTDLKSSPVTRTLGFPILALSTLHDAFARYPVQWFVTLSMGVVQQAILPSIPEVAALGRLWCVDSSFWPVVRSLAWLDRQGLRGVRLHLGLSLNALWPALILLTYDRAPTQSDRQALLAMAQSGLTYIVDRGYIKLGVYLGLIERGAFFVCRQKNNLQYRVLAAIDTVQHPALVAVTGLTDQVVRLACDPSGTLFRLVRFQVGTHQFQLLTNRWDLATWEIVMLYAWRWQVELIFRAWKHSLGALHLINLSESGIAIQFHILLIASVLLIAFEQEAARTAAACPSAHFTPRRARSRAWTPTAILSTVFHVSWRLARPFLRLVRNCLTQSVSFYLGRRAEMHL
jgi:hypothetical protein